MQVQDILGVPTHVYSLKHKSSSQPTVTCATDKKPSSLLLVIPGSPGMSHFYIPFASRLFQLGEGTYDVAVVSHAGHSPGFPRPPDHNVTYREHLSEISISQTQDRLEVEETGTAVSTAQDANCSANKNKSSAFTSPHRDWYNLEEQIAHKLAYIRQHTAHVDSLYLVGHSIGCWMILQLLKHLEPTKVKQAILLFPTIEKMGVTPNGIRMSPLFTSWRIPFTFGVWTMSWIPDFIKRYVLRRYFHTTPSDHVDHMIQGAINIDSKAIHNILCMANQEMNIVTDPPLEVVDTHIEKIVFYYGAGDRWTLDSCFNDMSERHPEKEVHLCQQGCDHAFVERSSDEMADFVHSKMVKRLCACEAKVMS